MICGTLRGDAADRSAYFCSRGVWRSIAGCYEERRVGSRERGHRTAVRPLRAVLPVFDIQCQLNLGSKVKHHKILRSQGETTIGYVNDRIQINVARVEDYFSVQLEVAS